MNYCCGMVAGTNKHQLWCQHHPDRNKEAALSAKSNQIVEEAGANAPQEPISPVALAVVASLEKTPDRWVTDGNEVWCVDSSMRVKVDGGWTNLKVELSGTGSHFSGDMPNSKASQAAIWNAYKAWQAKRMIAHAERPDEPPPPPITWKDRLLRGVNTLWFFAPAVGAILMAVVLTIFVITTMAAQDEARRATAAANDLTNYRNATDLRAQYTDLINRVQSARADRWFERLPEINIGVCGNDNACYRQLAERAARSEGRLVGGAQ